jgi:hypothetical protein
MSDVNIAPNFQLAWRQLGVLRELQIIDKRSSENSKRTLEFLSATPNFTISHVCL